MEETKNNNKTPETPERRRMRFGALDFVVILALLLIIAFPIVRYFAGDTGKKSSASVEITVLIQDVRPQEIRKSMAIYFPERHNTYIGTVSEAPELLYNYKTEDGEVDRTRVDALVKILATGVTVTAKGAVLLDGETYIDTGKTITVTISGTLYELYITILEVVSA